MKKKKLEAPTQRNKRWTYMYWRVVMLPSSSGIFPVIRFPKRALQVKEYFYVQVKKNFYRVTRAAYFTKMIKTHRVVRRSEAHAVGIVPLR